MDDGFIALPKEIDPHLLKNALNELDESIDFTMELGQKVSHPQNIETLNFLDIKIILVEGRFVNTDIYYKETNPHKYLDFNSAHPSHIKESIPFNLAKRIIVFVSDPELVQQRLKELEEWLLDCNYPLEKIRAAFHRAKVQGPAPEKCKKDILPLVTTYYPCLQFKNMMKTIQSLLNSFTHNETKRKFENSKTVLALKQPPNIKSLLTNSKFSSQSKTSNKAIPGIHLCNNSRCKLCKSYLQPVNSFTTANNTIWNIRSHITCHSKNIVYFLSCNLCEGNTNYIGQTTNLRNRMNNHISESRTEISSCIFPRHVFECGNRNKNLKEPFFKVYAFMALKSPHLLTTYENQLFRSA